MELVIYGAQGMALGVYDAIRTLYPKRKVLCFLVTEMGHNAVMLRGIPVRELREFVIHMSSAEKENVEVFICTPEDAMSSIEKSLEQVGIRRYVRFDSERWAYLMEKLFGRNRLFDPIMQFPTDAKTPYLEVYMAKFWRDKVVSCVYEIPSYMIPIQVGASLTEYRVAEVLDNVGDNISVKNANYSELTALYWIWKNQILIDTDKERHYYGLAHYRRFLMLDDDRLGRIQGNDIDVILPYPMPYEPDIEAHHRKYLSELEWNAVLQAIEEIYPECASDLLSVLKQKYFYNYNIIVAKGSVLAEYCAWLFPILERVEELKAKQGYSAPNRFIGYVGETLETLYFIHNRDRFKIAHTGCKFLC